MKNQTNTIKTGQTLNANCITDSDITFVCKVIERKGNFVTLDIDGEIVRKKVKVNYEGIEFVHAYGVYSMCPMFFGVEEIAPEVIAPEATEPSVKSSFVGAYSYFTKTVNAGGFDYTITLCLYVEKFHYVSLFKHFGVNHGITSMNANLGRQFSSFDAAQQAYKMPELKSAILLAEIEFNNFINA